MIRRFGPYNQGSDSGPTSPVEPARPIAMRLLELRLQNWRAIENARIPLEDITVLVGRNGAGKSSILDAVEFLRESVSDNLMNALERRGGVIGVARLGAPADVPVGLAVRMSLELAPGRTWQALYGLQFHSYFDHNGLDQIYVRERLTLSGTAGQDQGFFRDGAEFSSAQDIQPAVPQEGLVLNLVAPAVEPWNLIWNALRNLRAYDLSAHRMREPAAIEPGTNLHRDGRNFGDVTRDLRRRPEQMGWVLRKLGQVVPNIARVRDGVVLNQRMVYFDQVTSDELPDSREGWEAAERAGHVQHLDQRQVSQGTLRALGVLLALRQQPAPSLLLLDEIEESVHPHALAALLEAVEEAAEEFPVVLTTHSPEILSYPQIKPDHVRIVQWKAGISSLYPLSSGTLESVDPVTSLGDLLRMHALWPSDAPDQVQGDLLELTHA